MESKAITLKEIEEKYGEVAMFFSSYYKYSFTFSGEKDGIKFVASVGGDSSDIYRFDVTAGEPVLLKNLEPNYFSAKGDGVDEFYNEF